MNYTYSEHPQIWDCRHQVQVPEYGVVLGSVLQPISRGQDHRLKKGVPWLGSKHNANQSWSQRQHSRCLPSPPPKPPAGHTAVTKTSDQSILCLPRVLLPCMVTLLPKLPQRGPLRLSACAVTKDHAKGEEGTKCFGVRISGFAEDKGRLGEAGDKRM